MFHMVFLNNIINFFIDMEYIGLLLLVLEVFLIAILHTFIFILFVLFFIGIYIVLAFIFLLFPLSLHRSILILILVFLLILPVFYHSHDLPDLHHLPIIVVLGYLWAIGLRLPDIGHLEFGSLVAQLRGVPAVG
jgi:hypothetical protein